MVDYEIHTSLVSTLSQTAQRLRRLLGLSRNSPVQFIAPFFLSPICIIPPKPLSCAHKVSEIVLQGTSVEIEPHIPRGN